MRISANRPCSRPRLFPKAWQDAELTGILTSRVATTMRCRLERGIKSFVAPPPGCAPTGAPLRLPGRRASRARNRRAGPGAPARDNERNLLGERLLETKQ